jgi:carbon monoxide dehydrogenase subunit G
MRIQGSYRFTTDRQAIWKALNDPQTLAATLPGIKRLEVVGPDEYAVSADVGVGSVKGVYDGSFSLTDKKDFESCVLHGSARGGPGSVQVEVEAQLAEQDGGGTLLTYTADATITGPIAGVGQRMIMAASKRMGEQFFSAIDRVQTTGLPQPQVGASVDGGERAAVGQVFVKPPSPVDSQRSFVLGMLVGFALALIGVAVGRRTAR